MQSAQILFELEDTATIAPLSVTQSSCRIAADAILREQDRSTLNKAAEVALRICQRLYAGARSMEVLPIALAVCQRSSDTGDVHLEHRAAVAAGLLSSDTSDLAGAIEFHGQALAIKVNLGDMPGAGRSWNNIGSAFCAVGRYELAATSFQRALAEFDISGSPEFGRYSALTNLAQAAVHTGHVESGLVSARLALAELQRTDNKLGVDPFSELLLRRNLVRLLIANGDLQLAQEQVLIAKQLAAIDGSVRASIAVTTCQAVIDIACGHDDVAATRLERCLEASRPILPTLRDTLACMIRADEASGNHERALVRLRELSELIHHGTVTSAKAHLGLAEWRQSIPAFTSGETMLDTHARLIRNRGPASIPPMWDTLTRLALGGALQLEPSGAHGTRVGTLSRLLAQVAALGPVQSLEIGLAAQLHDIGIPADSEKLVGRFQANRHGAVAEEDLLHCDAGWDILRDDDHPRIAIARQIAKFHHAWVDGSGHPKGVGGKSIPLPARICAVADAYDNIMHDQKRVGGVTISAGLKQLTRLSGTRLDAELVQLFVQSLSEESHNEGIEVCEKPGLAHFHQLVNSLANAQWYI